VGRLDLGTHGWLDQARHQTHGPVVARGDSRVCLGNRTGDDRLLAQPAEDQTAAARHAAVETEGEFLEVGLKMFRSDRSLVGTEDPPLRRLATRRTPGIDTCAGSPEAETTVL
jgi:hypothetical protein